MDENEGQREESSRDETVAAGSSWVSRLLHSRRFLASTGVVIIVAGVLVWWLTSRWETTDDAQIDGHLNPISARISGQVTAVNFEDNQFVTAGTVLVQIDPTDYQVAHDRARAEYDNALAAARAARVSVPITSATAESQLMTARARVANARAGVTAAEKQLEASRAQLREAEANNARDQKDLARYEALVARGVVSRQSYDQVVARAKSSAAVVEAGQATLKAVRQQVAQANDALTQARAELQAARTAPEQVAVSRARSKGAEASVGQAKAALEQARINLGYTKVVAPVDGIVGRKGVEKGQYVQPGQQLFVIVPLDDIWVTANFKETQLRHMRPGQRVRIAVDTYRRSYDGRVTSIGGASGSRFSLFPPENATGNYVKVVQRIPVRIDIDKGQDREHLLRPGMSVVPRVRVR